MRAYGDLSLALPLGLGQGPSGAFKALDVTMQLLLIAVFWAWYVDAHVPSQVRSLWDHAQSLAYAIVKGNNAALGYAAAAAALPGSWWAPLFGAYVAVNGARLIENGMGAARKSSWDNDDLLAIVSGALIWFATAHLALSALVVRVLLVLFAFSSNWVNWQAKVAGLWATGTGAKRR